MHVSTKFVKFYSTNHQLKCLLYDFLLRFLTSFIINETFNYEFSIIIQVPNDIKTILNYLSGVEKETKYPEEVRKFALTLRYYSPRSFDYVRKKFGNNLPHPKTIAKWHQRSDIQTKSGICSRSLELLKHKVTELQEEGKELFAGLIFDEMHIKEHLQWMKNNKFSGFITFGKVAENCERLPLATQVLVFILSGINTSFHIPIAYFFIANLDAIDKVVLITSVIKLVNSTGVKLLTMTCDGHPTNISSNEMFGGSYDLNNLRPYFKNPENDSLVYTFLDPPHMLKLMRNALGSRKIFYDRLGRKIEWRYFVNLVNLNDDALLLSHKMTKAHINYEHVKKMNVSLAAQTFSQSVGESLKYLCDRKYSGFENAQGTAEFCLRIDQTFDILNSDIQRPDNVFKSPINEQSFPEICSFLDDTIDYLQKLTLKPFDSFVIKSEIKVGFKGMIIGLTNVKLIFLNVVQQNALQQFPVRSICQCSLESLFSRCRSSSMLGSNTNPTVSQFVSIMGKILVSNEITSSEFANCSDRLDILYVSSYIPKNPLHALPNNSRNVEETLPSENQCNIVEIYDNDDNNDENNTFEVDFEIDSLSNEQIGIACIAYEIDKRIGTNGVLKCVLCSKSITENDKLSIDSFPKSRSNQIPNLSTYKLCEITHGILEPHLLKHDFDFDETVSNIIDQIHPESFFSKTDFSAHPDHRDSMIKYIIKSYISLRASHIARKISVQSQFTRIEQRKNKQEKKG